MTSALGPWKPLSVQHVAELFTNAPLRWWISGGHALELHLGRSWREHDDTDVSFRRDDASGIVEVLMGWDIYLAAAGVLSVWDGAPLRPEDHHNNLWVRAAPDEPWVLDITIADGDDDHWVYRRQPDLSKPWDEAVLLDRASGVPYLAPELQLLFKSVATRPKDDIDAAQVIPSLTAVRAAWLRAALANDHPWQRLLSMRPG